MIGPDAMRKGLQFAYMSRSALVHLHTHGGTGRPEFSGVDLDDGKNFVPSFFNVVPHLPHALLVLSDESAQVHAQAGDGAGRGAADAGQRGSRVDIARELTGMLEIGRELCRARVWQYV